MTEDSRPLIRRRRPISRSTRASGSTAMRQHHFFTSDLSVNEFLLVKEAGFQPLGLVMGSSIYHIGFQPIRQGMSEELTTLTQALYSARELAMVRMEEEADALGADGIVARAAHAQRPRVGRERHRVPRDRHRGEERRTARASAAPRTASRSQSDLSGQDFWTLLHAGYRPLGLRDGQLRLSHRAPGPRRSRPSTPAEHGARRTTRRRCTTRASSRWSACRSRPRRSAPRASSASPSTRTTTRGARRARVLGGRHGGRRRSARTTTSRAAARAHGGRLMARDRGRQRHRLAASLEQRRAGRHPAARAPAARRRGRRRTRSCSRAICR